MKQYPIWLTGFGVGLVVPAILEVLIYEEATESLSALAY